MSNHDKMARTKTNTQNNTTHVEHQDATFRKKPFVYVFQSTKTESDGQRDRRADVPTGSLLILFTQVCGCIVSLFGVVYHNKVLLVIDFQLHGLCLTQRV